jgi:hypothetical protein
MRVHRICDRYLLGLDLGPPGEPTALAAVQQSWVDCDAHYDVRHLQRWPPGTPYRQIVDDLVKLTNEGPLCGADLLVDQTGVGRPVAKLFERACGCFETRRVVVTSGYADAWSDDGAQLVPKRDLVGTLQVLFQARSLRVAGQLSHAADLERELLSFRAKTPLAGAETAEAWRERPHDDLILAVAFACWRGERIGPPSTELPFVICSRTPIMRPCL